VTLGLPLAALYARVVRALAEDVRRAVGAAGGEARHEVRAARRRAAAVAMVRHVTRDFGALLGLALFVELIFGLPGLGRIMIETVFFTVDYPIGEGVLLATAGLAVTVQLAVDLVLAAALPEARPA
jgi:peptide/nickel transport system permease protein